MADPTLSIVTPSYNQADFIEECLESVRGQDYDDVEHVVVDGGSTDGTVEILEQYDDEYDLRWVSEPDEGQSDAVNKGIRMADGEWIGWQNSDDFYLSGAFEMFETARRDTPEADLIYGDVVVVNEESEEIRRLYQPRPSKFAHRYWSLFARNQATFFSQRVVDTVGYLNEDLEIAMDEEFFWRVLKTGVSVESVQTALGAFRVQSDAKTFGDSHEAWAEERARIYERSLYDRLFPRSVLAQAARATKAVNLLRDGRWEAIGGRLLR